MFIKRQNKMFSDITINKSVGTTTLQWDKDNYQISNIILSFTCFFSFENIIEALSDNGLYFEEDKVKAVLSNLNNAGLVLDYGSRYGLSSLVK